MNSVAKAPALSLRRSLSLQILMSSASYGCFQGCVPGWRDRIAAGGSLQRPSGRSVVTHPLGSGACAVLAWCGRGDDDQVTLDTRLERNPALGHAVADSDEQTPATAQPAQ